MRKARFPTGMFNIDFAERIDGCCDAPADSADELSMTILDGDNFRAFHSAVHEGMHAHGIPSQYIHDKDGCATTEDIARFLWRRLKKMKQK